MRQHQIIRGRFTASKKAQLLSDITMGLITKEEAKDIYALSDMELDHWKDKKEKMGVHGLKVRNCRAVA